MLCDRNRKCIGNKCLKSIIERDGAIKKYKDELKWKITDTFQLVYPRGKLVTLFDCLIHHDSDEKYCKQHH